jgi:nucleotide-binding universal stress UspA family protein
LRDPQQQQYQRDEISSFPPKRILVPVDGSSNSFRALDVAVRIAKKFSAEIRVLYVLQNLNIIVRATAAPGTPVQIIDQYYRSAEEEATSFLSQMMSIAKQNQVHCTEEILRTGSSIVNAIVLDARAEGTNLIVIGTRGLGGFDRLLLGNISSGVVAHAGCSVLVVR